MGPLGIRGAHAFEGEFLDLAPFVDDETLAQYDPEQVAVWADGDHLQALPFGVFPSMIFFNKDIFDRADLPYPPAEFGGTYQGEPWDIDALTELAIQLTVDADGNNANSPDFDDERILQWGFAHQWIDDPRSNGAFFGAGSLLAEDGSAQIPHNWREQWQWLHDGIFNDHFMPDADQRSTELLQLGNPFASGRLAMAFTHLWYAGSATTPEGDPLDFWDLAATPTYNGEITSKLHADTFRIMGDSESPDEAFEALSYLLDEGAADLLQIYGSFPACLLYTSPSPRDATLSRMPSSA